MSGATQYIGSKISLISKSDIRYEGILYTIDPVDCTIALAKVKSMGTEDRPTDRPVPPRMEVYEYIVFRGADIRDIRVCEPPKPQPVLAGGLPNDPAILQHSVPPTTSAANTDVTPAPTPDSAIGSLIGSGNQAKRTVTDLASGSGSAGVGSLPATGLLPICPNAGAAAAAVGRSAVVVDAAVPIPGTGTGAGTGTERAVQVDRNRRASGSSRDRHVSIGQQQVAGTGTGGARSPQQRNRRGNDGLLRTPPAGQRLPNNYNYFQTFGGNDYQQNRPYYQRDFRQRTGYDRPAGGYDAYHIDRRNIVHTDGFLDRRFNNVGYRGGRDGYGFNVRRDGYEDRRGQGGFVGAVNPMGGGGGGGGRYTYDHDYMGGGSGGGGYRYFEQSMRPQQHQQQYSGQGYGGGGGGSQYYYYNNSGGGRGGGGGQQRRNNRRMSTGTGNPMANGGGGGGGGGGAANVTSAASGSDGGGSGGGSRRITFNEEFDFETANNEFEHIKEKFSEMKIDNTEVAAAAGDGGVGKSAEKKDEKENDDDKDNKNDANDKSDDENVAPSTPTKKDSVKKCYDPTSSFFDNLSSVLPKTNNMDRNREVKLNLETFGERGRSRGRRMSVPNMNVGGQNRGSNYGFRGDFLYANNYRGYSMGYFNNRFRGYSANRNNLTGQRDYRDPRFSAPVGLYRRNRRY